MTKEYQDYLAHFGIPGQKWGKRRFQNEDGTYTQEGRDRYGFGDEEEPYQYFNPEAIKKRAASRVTGMIAERMGVGKKEKEKPLTPEQEREKREREARRNAVIKAAGATALAAIALYGASRARKFYKETSAARSGLYLARSHNQSGIAALKDRRARGTIGRAEYFSKIGKLRSEQRDLRKAGKLWNRRKLQKMIEDRTINGDYSRVNVASIASQNRRQLTRRAKIHDVIRRLRTWRQYS